MKKTFIIAACWMACLNLWADTPIQLSLMPDMKSLKIGLLNVAMNNSWFNDFPDKLAPAFPIVNWSF